MEKIVPEIRFKGFSGEWTSFTLGELGTVAMNKRIFKHQTAIAGEVPFFKIGTFGKQPDAFISKTLFDEYKNKYPYPATGDLLLSASGSIGRIVEYKGEEQYFQDSNIVWLKHDGRIDNAFLKVFYSVVKWSGLEGSTIKRLYNKNILDTEICTPERPEQTAIGSYFQKLDNLINQHQQKHDKLSNIKKAMLEKMFPKQGETIPEIRFKGFSGEWEHFTIGYCSSLITKGTTPMTIGRSFVDSGISFVKVESVDEIGNISQSKFAYIDAETDQILARSRIKENDLLISIAGALGRAAIVKKEILPANTNQALAIVRLKNDSPVKVKFLYHFTKTKDFKDFVDASASQGAQPNLSLGDISNVRILAPKKEEQTAIGNYFQKLDNLINQHQQQITKLNNIKQACLSKMFV